MVDSESIRDKAEDIPKKPESEGYAGEIQMILYALADLLEEERK